MIFNGIAQFDIAIPPEVNDLGLSIEEAKTTILFLQRGMIDDSVIKQVAILICAYLKAIIDSYIISNINILDEASCSEIGLSSAKTVYVLASLLVGDVTGIDSIEPYIESIGRIEEFLKRMISKRNTQTGVTLVLSTLSILSREYLVLKEMSERLTSKMAVH